MFFFFQDSSEHEDSDFTTAHSSAGSDSDYAVTANIQGSPTEVSSAVTLYQEYLMELVNINCNTVLCLFASRAGSVQVT